MVLGADPSAAEARRASTRRALYLGTTQNRRASAELDAYARARLDPLYGISVVEDDPYAPDARFAIDDDTPPADCPLRSAHRVPRPCSGANGHDGPCTFAPARRRIVAPAAPAPTAEPSRCWQYLHTQGGTRRCVRTPDYHDGEHEYEPTVTPIGPTAPTAPTAPPQLASVPSIAPAGRPSCPRCGQTFRKHGAGLVWHVDNRPDCASGARRLAVAQRADWREREYLSDERIPTAQGTH